MTLVPYQLGTGLDIPEPMGIAVSDLPEPTANGDRPPTESRESPDGSPRSISTVDWRQHAVVEGRIEQLVIETVHGVPNLAAVMGDGTGRLDLLFLGRRKVGGVELGARVRATGLAASHRGRLTMLNPLLEVLAPAPRATPSPLEATHHEAGHRG